MNAQAGQRVAQMFVEVADTLVDDFDLIEFLQMVTSHASDLIGTSAAGLLLADRNGHLRFMAASNEQTELLELFQVQAEEGPCQDCFRQGVAVTNADLTTASARWPLFAPRAVAAGFRSVHAFPMRLRGHVIGALNLFGSDTGPMDSDDVKIVQALADVATIGLLQQRAVRRGEVLTEQLQGALNSRIVIEQAKGVVAQVHGVGVDEAFQLIRSYARRHNLHLQAVAHAVIDDPASVPELVPG
jgi:GAF domain-containing protein